MADTNYHINPDTGVWDDNYYANTGRFLESGQSGGGDDYVSSFASLLGSVTPYEEKAGYFSDVWAKDEALARESVVAEYSPYYTEKLTDYTSSIEQTRSRSQEDMKRTLEFLAGGKEYYLGNARRLLDKAMRSSNEGFAGKGLFFSGAREKDIRELKEEESATTGEYLRGYEYNKAGTEQTAKRTGEDLALNQKMYTRDIEREKKLAIEAGVLARKGEALQEYETGRSKYYSQYPSYYQGVV